MIIACPRCGASYEIEDALFGSRPRAVECSSCGLRWKQPPPRRVAVPEATSSAHAEPILPQVSAPEAADLAPASAEELSAETAQVPDEEGAGLALSPAEEVSAAPAFGSEDTSSQAEEPPVGEATPAADGEDAVADSATAEPDAGATDESPADGAQSAGDSGDAAVAEPEPVVPRATAAVRPPPPPARSIFRSRTFIVGVSAATTALILIAMLIVLRGTLMDAIPAATKVYDTVGLAPDPLGAGLEIREVASTRERQGGEDVLLVRGVVANVGERTAPLPQLRVSLWNVADEEVLAVIVPHEAARLAPGEKIRFEANIANPPPEARILRVGFTEPHM